MSDNPSMIPGTPEPNGSAAPLGPSSPQGQASQSRQPQAAGYTNVQQAQPQASQPTQSQAQGQPQQAASSSFGSTQGYSNQGAPQPPYVQQPYAGGYAAPQYAYAPAQAAQPKKGGKGGWIALGIILFAIVFVFTIGALSCSHTVSSLTSGADAFSSMSDEVITSGDSVGVIDMMGTIQYDGSSCSPEGLRDLLKEAEENPDIKAVVLRVDSGGGTATAGEEMAWDVAAARRGLAAFDEALAASGEARGCLLAYRRRWLGEACPLDAMSSFVWQRADDLMRVAFAGEGVEAAARRLVGAGQGLTPAGDDFIAGALCVLGGVDHPAARRVRQAVADGVGAPGVLDATTRVSRQMLACELAGQAASTHLRFQRALLRDACDAGPALSELLSVGHTSGADFAAGAADALRRLVLLTGDSGRRR